MSDSNFSKLCEWKKVHEVVDEAWAEDCLSDDEVELPAGETFGDEGEVDSGDVLTEKEPERWNDLELEEAAGGTPRRSG